MEVGVRVLKNITQFFEIYLLWHGVRPQKT